MNRPYVLMATGLLVLGLFFDLRMTRAFDHDRPASALQPAHLEPQPEIATLSQRIESLERRLSTLEGPRPLIRQADNREAGIEFGIGTEMARETPVEGVDDTGETQVTNGHKWKFRLLGHQSK